MVQHQTKSKNSNQDLKSQQNNKSHTVAISVSE